MISECIVSTLLNLTLFVLLLFLLLDHCEELITLSLGLLGQHDFALNKLLATGKIKLFGLLASQFSLLFLFQTGFALSFLEGTLGSKSIDLTLTISSTLLLLPQTLDLKLFLFGLAPCFGSIGFLLSHAFSVVTDDFQILLPLLDKFLLLEIKSNLV